MWKDSPGKGKPTLESLLNDRHVITGKHLIKQQKEVALEAARQKAVLEEAIEFEQRNRRSRAEKA
ncbi:hypothetical protein [Polynucleobacter sp. MG-27-Goln-C1]|uniref:hypothetical protein n=1 Tax=Polynucleobacter sp. MG-27-Goln-C1 TaxID=1819726 RepID=UPI001C0B66A4|nr:hypothetical protein [Polynucleobacter sp. MG-27-Goln-C1]MBU3612947.1 hypothetical protein [Polynucleobacter sp. MG-27-Goln-C1]